MTPEHDKLRVNARFDQVAEAQLRYLVEVTGMNVTEVLRHSVASLYQQTRARQARPIEALLASGLIGAFDSGDPDGSEQVKAVVATALDAKLGRSG